MSSIIQKQAEREKLTEPAAATPMMAQYLEVKAKHPGFLLFYRMGDFFELFFEDAVIAAGALGIQLTKRGRHLGQDIPMCGVPVSRADDYLQKLIRHGLRVAIAEQLEDPAAAKKRGPKSVVTRDVVRLVTPGTLTEDALLNAKAHNFLTAIASIPKKNGYALASLDISTGEFVISETSIDGLEAELMRLQPSEVLTAEGANDPAITAACAANAVSVSQLSRTCFTKAKGEQGLKSAFELEAIEGLGDFSETELCATGALLHYVTLTQMGQHPALRLPRRDRAAALLVIDASTRASLELVRPRNDHAPTLFSAIDRTVTAAGARELAARLVSPSADASVINRRLDAVALFIDDWALRERMRGLLKTAPDISRALSRIKLRRAGPRDVAAVGAGLRVALDASQSLSANPVAEVGLSEIVHAFAVVSEHLTLEIEAALCANPVFFLRDGGFIASKYDAKLDELRALASDTKGIIARLQSQYVSQTGLSSLKIQFNNLMGYFIEVSAAGGAALQAEPHAGLFRHKQTLASGMRFTTDELSTLESRIVTASAEAQAREIELFNDLSARILEHEQAIANVARALGDLDCLTALADLAQTQNYVRPIIDHSRAFIIEAGRHPAVEQVGKREGWPFIANDCKLDGDGHTAPALLLVTGPNMAGKSTYLRQNALIVVLAQIGSFVPATSAHIGVADKLFSRIGAADDLARGRSTFMVEMTETAGILNQATAQSLVVLDEIGRGTSTFDGLSIAWAVVEDLHNRIGCRGLIATHYHELTRLCERLPRVANVRMTVTEWKDTLVFLHGVEPGAALRSYGVQAARLSGIPKHVIARAKAVLAELEAQQPGGNLGGMLLFSWAPTETPAPSELHPVLVKLASVDPDALSPRQALDILFELCRIREADQAA